MYVILNIEEKNGIRILKIADPWGNGPNILGEKKKQAIVDIEFSVFLESFTRLIFIKVITF